ADATRPQPAPPGPGPRPEPFAIADPGCRHPRPLPGALSGAGARNVGKGPRVQGATPWRTGAEIRLTAPPSAPAPYGRPASCRPLRRLGDGRVLSGPSPVQVFRAGPEPSEGVFWAAPEPLGQEPTEQASPPTWRG